MTLSKLYISFDFRFYKHIGDLDAFKLRWCFNDIVCSVVDEELVFAQVFIG